MNNLVLAVLFMCNTGEPCTEVTVKVPPQACHVQYNGERPQNGVWIPTKVGVRCR